MARTDGLEAFEGAHYKIETADENDRAYLKDRWAAFTDLSPEQFADELRLGLSEDVKVLIWLYPKAETYVRILGSGQKTELNYTFNSSVSSRCFGCAVDHIKRIDATPKRQGIGSQMLANILRLKPPQHPIVLVTSDIGSNFWNKLGWDPIQKKSDVDPNCVNGWFELRESLTQRLMLITSYVVIDPDDLERLCRALKNDNPKALSRVVNEDSVCVDAPLGWQLMRPDFESWAKQQGWDIDVDYYEGDTVSYKAIFDPSDPDCMARLYSRLGRYGFTRPQPESKPVLQPVLNLG